MMKKKMKKQVCIGRLLLHWIFHLPFLLVFISSSSSRAQMLLAAIDHHPNFSDHLFSSSSFSFDPFSFELLLAKNVNALSTTRALFTSIEPYCVFWGWHIFSHSLLYLLTLRQNFLWLLLSRFYLDWYIRWCADIPRALLPKTLSPGPSFSFPLPVANGVVINSSTPPRPTSDTLEGKV